MYIIEEISIIKVYVLVIDELEEGLEKELKFLKIFIGEKFRDGFINNLFDKEEDEEEILLWLLLLYEDKTMVIAKEKGIKFSGLEEKVEKLAKAQTMFGKIL